MTSCLFDQQFDSSPNRRQHLFPGHLNWTLKDADWSLLPMTATGQLQGVCPLHPEVLIHPIEHGASKLPQDRAQCASHVGHVELVLQELGQEVKIPSIRLYFLAALPDLLTGGVNQAPRLAWISTNIQGFLLVRAFLSADVSDSEKGCGPP